jgi:hypothetical protein
MDSTHTKSVCVPPVSAAYNTPDSQGDGYKCKKGKSGINSFGGMSGIKRECSEKQHTCSGTQPDGWQIVQAFAENCPGRNNKVACWKYRNNVCACQKQDISAGRRE